MTVVDDTFTKIVLRASNDPDAHYQKWVYYRHPETGGLVDNPLQAQHISTIDDYLYKCEDWAREHWPNYAWERARLIVDVQPFHHPEALDKIIDMNLRERALKKLSTHERRALGLLRGETS